MGRVRPRAGAGFKGSQVKQVQAMDALIMFGLFVALPLAALRWGADSRDGIESCEWERRRRWRGFGA